MPLTCPNCGADMYLIAFISSKPQLPLAVALDPSARSALLPQPRPTEHP